MFSFFKKKYFLKELFLNFTDIHNHILPGLDDGAKNIEASMALINGYKEIGIEQVIATPHVMNDFYPNNFQSIRQSLEIIQRELRLKDEKFRIKAAAEYMMDQSFLDLLEKDALLCLNENYVLVEMSYFQPPINLNEILFNLKTKQYKPVLAHPERYMFYHSKSLEKYADLKSRGCYFQLNALSITGHYGKRIQEIAFKLLEHDLIDFIGTDAHQARHLEKLQKIKIGKHQINSLLPVIEKTRNTFAF